jgi:hypothetical protein
MREKHVQPVSEASENLIHHCPRHHPLVLSPSSHPHQKQAPHHCLHHHLSLLMLMEQIKKF